MPGFVFFYLGLGLIVLPAALIGINHKYQTIVSLGRGYIPVYLQYCGLAFIIIALIAWLNNTKFSRNRTLILYSFIAVSFSSLISLSVIFNTRSVDMMNIMVETNNRFLLENALAHELLAKVPNEANLVERFRIWNTKEFYMLNAHKKFKAIYLVDGFEKLPVSMSANTFFIDSKNLAGSRDGYVIIGNFIRQKEIKNPLIFIATDNPDHLNKVVSNLQQKLNLSPLEVASILASYAKSSHQKEFLYSLPAATYLFS